jgi:hypothetical protein
MERSPFEVLGIPTTAGVDAARSRYRALARQQHPDAVPAAQRSGATKAMAELNWAMEELERDLEGWRRLAGGDAADLLFEAYKAPSTPVAITVEPRLVILRRENGFEAWITAAAPGVDPRDLKLRYESKLIEVARMQTRAGVTNFRVRLAPGAEGIAEEQSQSLEISAPDGEPATVRVAVAAFGAADNMSLRRQPRVSLAHAQELLIGAAAFLGALGALILIA